MAYACYGTGSTLVGCFQFLKAHDKVSSLVVIMPELCRKQLIPALHPHASFVQRSLWYTCASL